MAQIALSPMGRLCLGNMVIAQSLYPHKHNPYIPITKLPYPISPKPKVLYHKPYTISLSIPYCLSIRYLYVYNVFIIVLDLRFIIS